MKRLEKKHCHYPAGLDNPEKLNKLIDPSVKARGGQSKTSQSMTQRFYFSRTNNRNHNFSYFSYNSLYKF